MKCSNHIVHFEMSSSYGLSMTSNIPLDLWEWRKTKYKRQKASDLKFLWRKQIFKFWESSIRLERQSSIYTQCFRFNPFKHLNLPICWLSPKDTFGKLNVSFSHSSYLPSLLSSLSFSPTENTYHAWVLSSFFFLNGLYSLGLAPSQTQK